jgi:hypothetical protein
VDSLEEVEIEKCKNVKDYEVLGKLTSLRKIVLTESGVINSIAFVKKLPKLRFLAFWGTKC